MVIRKYGIDSAPFCEGRVVVIDVIRSCTTAAFCFYREAKEIFLVSTAQEAFALKQKNPDFMLVGENEGRKIEGFDLGNSPEAVAKLDLRWKSVVLRSSSGTQGVVAAKKATEIYLGSLVVAKATMHYLKTHQGASVTILAMGSRNGPDKEDDLACGDYMEALYCDTSVDRSEICRRVVESPAGQMALDPKIDFKTPGDLECAISVDKFDFIMPVYREGPYLISRMLKMA